MMAIITAYPLAFIWAFGVGLATAWWIWEYRESGSEADADSERDGFYPEGDSPATRAAAAAAAARESAALLELDEKEASVKAENSGAAIKEAAPAVETKLEEAKEPKPAKSKPKAAPKPKVAGKAKSATGKVKSGASKAKRAPSKAKSASVKAKSPTVVSAKTPTKKSATSSAKPKAKTPQKTTGKTTGKAPEKSQKNAAVKATPKAAPKAAPKAKPKSKPKAKPKPKIVAAQGPANDLQKIKGVGPKLEALCNSLGVKRFDQIAAWKSADIKEVDSHLGQFKGRVGRDKWVAQAKLLAAGRVKEHVRQFGD